MIQIQLVHAQDRFWVECLILVLILVIINDICRIGVLRHVSWATFLLSYQRFSDAFMGIKENIGKKSAEVKYHFIGHHHYWTLSWVGKFIGNRREITQIIWTYQISITFSKILRCYPIQLYLLRWWIYYRFLLKKLFRKIAIIRH